MRTKYLYIYNTTDEFEFPLAVASSASELARMVGTTANSIYSTISHRQKKGLKSRFHKVPWLDENEEMGREIKKAA